MRDPATDRVRPVARAGHEDGYLDAGFAVSATLPEGMGPTGIAMRTGARVTTTDIATDPRMAPWREAALARGFRSSAAVPLRRDGHVAGILSIYSAEAGFFTDEEQRLLTEIGDDLSHALDALSSAKERNIAPKGTDAAARTPDASPEDGVGRPAGRRRGARLQQHARRDPGPRRAGAGAGSTPDIRCATTCREIRAAADRSAELTRQLLAFARRQTDHAPGARPQRDRRRHAQDAAPPDRRGHRARLDAGRALWPVRMDPSQVDQVLANLCVNARDAIGGVGTITIEHRQHASSTRLLRRGIPGCVARATTCRSP